MKALLHSFNTNNCLYTSVNDGRLLLPLTIAASFHLTHPVEGICNQVRESPVQVHGGQAALVPVPGCYQLGQIAVHVLCHATDVQLPWKADIKKPTVRIVVYILEI